MVADHGVRYMIVTSILEDPQYLTQSFVRSAQFKFQPDATGWNPDSLLRPDKKFGDRVLNRADRV